MKDKELIKEIRKKFNNYEIGYIKDRYISEFDLMLHFGVNTIIYYLALLCILPFKNPIYYFVGLVIIFILVYILYNKLTDYIYFNAPFKNEWKTIKIENEESKSISKRMKLQLIAFLAIIIFFGSSVQYINYLLLLGPLFSIVVFIKIYFLYKSEKNSINKKSR